MGTAEVLRENRAPPLHTCVEGLDFPEPCPVQRTMVTPRSCPQETKEASAHSSYPLSQAEPALDLPPFCLLSCWYWSPPLDSRQRLQEQRGGERPPCLATPCLGGRRRGLASQGSGGWGRRSREPWEGDGCWQAVGVAKDKVPGLYNFPVSLQFY